jgi:ribulose-phosphate 3-epimerase
MIMISSPIVPAIIPQSLSDLHGQVNTLSGLPELHLDVVDGVFVPFTSWPYNSDDKPLLAKPAVDIFSLEIDLMVDKPLVAAREWLEAGADALVFHVESISPIAFKEFVADTNISVGISANNDTAESILNEYVPFADYVQVMGIATIGAQGQAFDKRALERIVSLKNNFPNLPISIDGSVNLSTLAKIIPHKPDRYIVGSAIIKQTKPIEAYQNLTSLVGS